MITKVGCDDCGKLFDVETLNWFNDVDMLCDPCTNVRLAQTPAVPEVKTKPGFPVFVYYADDRVLHVSCDVDSPYRWEQSPGWWFLSVTSISVKFFATQENAELARKRLTLALQPLFGLNPIAGDVEVEPGDVFEMESKETSLDYVLHTRIEHSKYLELTKKAARLGVNRGQYVRSLLYYDLSQSS